MAYGDLGHLSPSQKKIARAIIRGGRKAAKRHGWSKQETRKAINTGLAVGYTEARYSNPSGGDRDSAGWRQERAMYYKNPTNIPASVKRFYDEYQADAPKGSSLGARAQAVQQSGTPNVWDNLAPMANKIRRELSGSAGAEGGGGGGRERGKYERGHYTGKTVTTPGVSREGEREALKMQTLTTALAQGRMPSQSELLGLAGGLRSIKDTPATSDLQLGYKKGKYKRGKRARKGGKAGEPRGSMKDGWKGSKTVIQPAREVAKRFGMPISSEKRSTVNTASGGVSDHYEGNKEAYALDISTTSGHKAARRIAKRFGMGYKPDVWNEKTITVRGRQYRVQIGHGQNLADHADHIHVGVKRVG